MINTYTLTVYMARDHRIYYNLSRVAVKRYLNYHRVRDSYRGHSLTSS